MREKMRAAMWLVALAAIVETLLLVVTAMTRSWVSAVVAAILGIVLAVGAVTAARRIADRLILSGDRTATRVGNLEKRLQILGDEESMRTGAMEQADERLLGLQREIAEIRESARGLPRVERGVRESWRLSTETALELGRHPRSFLTKNQAQELFDAYIGEGRFLEVAPLTARFDLLSGLDLGTLRSMYRFYRATGYWNLAVRVLRRVATASRRTTDERSVVRLEHEIALFSRPEKISVELQARTAYDPSGPVLHMVGNVLPVTQSGYTLRTHFTAAAQKRRGLRVVVVGQSGAGPEEDTAGGRYRYDGVDYQVLPGPARGASDLPDEWLRQNIRELALIVGDLRPSILHAHSDFHNALIVHAVGRAFGIPTVYETRGFWEESWLTRVLATNHWERDAANLFDRFGHPDAYTLRMHAERTARSLVDHNVTLAGVMREHILDIDDGDMEPSSISVVPNAADGEAFAVQARDPGLARELGLPEDAVTVGYISSMVAYEGIETLIDAFRMASERVSQPLFLLLVGDGHHLENLKAKVSRSGTENVIFTGAVPHSEVLRYYGLIDIFVVPRGKSTVADLVTPLKPFEAFATGRAVILSDVDALQEIAEVSGVAETFRAGYHRDLGRRIVELARDPMKRRDLGVRAARWVRAERSWDANTAAYEEIYRQLDPHRLPAAGHVPPGPIVAGEDSPAATGVRQNGLLRRGAHRLEPVAPADRNARESSALDSERKTHGEAASSELAPRGWPSRAVVVAMKPQIAGRIRRNILTLLDLGSDVTVVNSVPRADFFQGLTSPALSADFVEVRSLAVRYQDRMTRKKNERQAAWDRQKRQDIAIPTAASGTARGPVRVPGAEAVRRLWSTPAAADIRERWERRRRSAEKGATTFLRTTRSRRDLTIRDELKRVHLVNRFLEFWRLAPERIAVHKPDLIVSSDLPGLVGASIAARRLGVPHLHDCHELYLESTTLRPSERRFLWPIEKRYLRRADAVVVVNETIRDEYEKRYGVRGTVLRNCAPAVPDSVRGNPIDIRALAGIPRASRVVLYQGGFMAGRGLDVCVRAMRHLPPDVHLVMIGRGRLLEELQALAREVGVADRVHWLPAVEPADLAAYTASADLGVIPYQPVSRNNRFALPNKVFEYTGAGIPIVSSDLPELRRIVEASGCGALYDPASDEGMAVAVEAVLAEGAYGRFRTSAEQFGKENTWEREREILIAEIRRIMQR